MVGPVAGGTVGKRLRVGLVNNTSDLLIAWLIGGGTAGKRLFVILVND